MILFPARLMTKAATRSGTLIQNTEDHEKLRMSAPPMMGPTAIPAPLAAVQAAMALARSRGSPNTLTRIDNVVGMIRAPPTPMMQRPAMRAVVEVAVAATTDPPRNVARPATSAWRRPKRSPMLPAVRSSPANTIVYEATTHCSWAEFAPRSLTSWGMATLTMVWSMEVTRRARTSTPRMRHRLGWLAWDSPRDWVTGRPCMMTPWFRYRRLRRWVGVTIVLRGGGPHRSRPLRSTCGEMFAARPLVGLSDTERRVA